MNRFQIIKTRSFDLFVYFLRKYSINVILIKLSHSPRTIVAQSIHLICRLKTPKSPGLVPQPIVFWYSFFLTGLACSSTLLPDRHLHTVAGQTSWSRTGRIHLQKGEACCQYHPRRGCWPLACSRTRSFSSFQYRYLSVLRSRFARMTDPCSMLWRFHFCFSSDQSI